MKYGPLSSVMLDSAQKYNEHNPRIYYLRGTGLAYTPPMFGGGKDKAKPILETAVEKYKTFIPESDISPDWGEQETFKMLEYCGKDDPKLKDTPKLDE